MKTIRIGSGAGYAGDRLEPALELIEKGNIDYISFECLAERTIAIAQMAKLKDPNKGYNDLLSYRMEQVIPLAWERKSKLLPIWGPPIRKLRQRFVWKLPGKTAFRD